MSLQQIRGDKELYGRLWNDPELRMICDVAERKIFFYLTHQVTLHNKRVLDVGCGNGWLGKACIKKKATLCIGIDLGHSLGCKVSEENPLVIADGCSLPFENGTFDIVALCEVLEHLGELRGDIGDRARAQLAHKVLEEGHRVLKLGGCLFITVPNKYFPIEIHTFMPFINYLPRQLRNAVFRILHKHKFLIPNPRARDYLSPVISNYTLEELIQIHRSFSSSWFFSRRIYTFGINHIGRCHFADRLLGKILSITEKTIDGTSLSKIFGDTLILFLFKDSC